ncbi:extracellular matrix protein FRAS1-like [Trichogramma pretiosum]|uniref:extracellular matrix protein FRAS1-like n=1 Tax=Trichogramma pretiosum TaxID=7493 RepID=UPI0006C99DC7|nr:extracellular matrix protein FRAS1-like [Trichogramma pretiosum]
MSLAAASILPFLLIIGASIVSKDCSQVECKGPLKYYNDLRCEPVYKNANDCCPISYDCSHLRSHKSDKCYANGHEYSIGETLRDEDRSSACDIACICRNDYKNRASFLCAAVDCYRMRPAPGCYWRQNPDSCCGGEEVCPERPEDRYRCEVAGKIYQDGDEFQPDANTVCQCAKGYAGENVEPFCRAIKCGVELHRLNEVRDNCAPYFYSGQNPSTSCAFAYRCPNDNDTILVKQKENGSNDAAQDKAQEEDSDVTCTFGNLKMRIGDELSESTEPGSNCVKCTCQVPPMPTCVRLDQATTC